LEASRSTLNLGKNSDKQPTGQLLPGAILANRYLIQGVIGIGGMGAVYRARDLHFPNVTKLIAVKEMINQAQDPEIRKTIIQNFEREANILATLSHPAIPRVHDYFTNNERSYLILEFIHGKDMETMLNDSNDFFPEDQIIAWAIELCDVLQYLHNHEPEPIIFRDLKPSNVMINQHNHVVLIDFGIAKHFQSGKKGTMIGTEGYSPPEQYRGEENEVSDIYALGACLHHILSRRDPRLEPPFSFNERPIRQTNQSVSPELENTIIKSLQYEPKDRYQTAEEFKKALVLIARNTGVLTSEPQSTARIQIKSQDITPIWRFSCEDDIRGTPTVDDDVVYVGSYDYNLYALKAKTGDFIWKYPTEGGIVTKPAVSQGIIVFGSEDRNVYAISAQSGRFLWSYATSAPVRSSPRVTEGHIFIGSDDGYLHVISLQNGRRVWRLDAGTEIRSTPLITNEAIYFGTESGELYCSDLSGDVRWRFKAKRAITSSPVIYEGSLYFGSMDATLYSIEANAGWVLWRFRMDRGSISTPFISGNLVYTGSASGHIYCINARSSKEVWRFETDHQVTGSPVLYQNRLYCGSVDGNLYCLDHRTGHLHWKYQTGEPITGTPVIHNNLIIIGSTDNHLYALPV
jgi:outer membrane protein assembly factor BamB/tRNA A-37 threonylcarbamoyl transferase component Bud32